MKIKNIKTLGQLRKAGYQSKSIKEELRDNLIEKIRSNETVFKGIYGYENTVIPQLEHAILSKHNINFLGLRGQAKTKLARLMIHLLDEYIPIVEHSEINDDPLNPVSRFACDRIKEEGVDTPITWLHREERFSEKLATPDVTVADLIGDVDPIKADNLKLSYADDRVLHYGMIPRANRGIFVINELPDLQARIQVALFNILQEGDIQIRGFKLRLALDLQFIFTANPEDYTNRGSIVTPLKDRIGSQILTHYPQNLEDAKKITAQESHLLEAQKDNIIVPELVRDLLEQISFEARNSEYVDLKSGISARMSISAYQNLMSTAERRMLSSSEDFTSIGFSDFMGIIPAITGKVELVYEGEQEGAAFVAQALIENSVKSLFPDYFPKIEKLERKDAASPYDELVKWFQENKGIELFDDQEDKEYHQTLESIAPLKKLIEKYRPGLEGADRYFLMEFVLWGLAVFKKLSKHRIDKSWQFDDLFGNYIVNNL
jgi:magnesium chelatase subunit I